MLTVRPTGKILGATIEGLDLSRPCSNREFAPVGVSHLLHLVF